VKIQGETTCDVEVKGGKWAKGKRKIYDLSGIRMNNIDKIYKLMMHF